MNVQSIKRGSLAFILLMAIIPCPMYASPLFSLLCDSAEGHGNSSTYSSWRKYDFNRDNKFDQADINELVYRGPQTIEFDLNHDGKKDIDDALALFLILSVMDRSCNGEVDDRDFEPVDPVSLPDVPNAQTVRRIVSEKVAQARIKLPSDIEDQAFRSVPKGKILTLAEKAYVYQIAGLSGLAQRNLDAAIWGFGRSFLTDGSSSGAIGSMAFCLAVEDKDEEALLLLAYAREIFPKSAPTATSLGWIFARHSQNEEALKYLREAVLYTPEIAQYHMNLGVLLMRMGKEREAYEEFRKGMDLDPSDARKYLFCYTTKPPDEPPAKKTFNPEEFSKERDIEINEMVELGYTEDELPEPWNKMSPCDQSSLIPEILERRLEKKIEEITLKYSNECAKKIEEIIKGYMPEWKNFTKDFNRYLEGLPEVNKQGAVLTKAFEKKAENEILALIREMGTELLGYSSFIYESALKQASADANEELKGVSDLPVTAQSLTELKANAYKEALDNAMKYCYKPLIDQAYKWMRIKSGESGSYSLPSPTVAVINVQDYNMMFFLILDGCFEIKGYCPDGEGGDIRKPEISFDPTISIDLFLLSFEWNPVTNEFELNLGQGLMVGMTWKPETGFGVQVGLGVHGSTGIFGGEAAVYCRLDEGRLALETELGGQIGLFREKGSLGVGFETVVTHATHQLY